MKLWLYTPIAAVLFSSLLVSCLEDDDGRVIENIEEKLEGQRFDIGRTKQFIAAEKIKLADYLQADKDLKETEELTISLEESVIGIAEGKTRNSDLADAVDLTKLELDQYQQRYRKYVREKAIGEILDLSSTKGEDYKAVRLMSVTPLAIKVYMPSGPEAIPLRDLTPSIRELLQMSEEEAASYLERKGESIAERAAKYKKWKEGQSERDEEAAKKAILQRMKDLQEEIYRRESAIGVRLDEMKVWKEKASELELRASRDRQKGRSDKMERLAELARDKALVLSDLNSDSWIVVGRHKAELEDLKRMGIRPTD